MSDEMSAGAMHDALRLPPELLEFATASRAVKAALDRADASAGHRLSDGASFGAGLKVGDIRKLILATDRLVASAEENERLEKEVDSLRARIGDLT